jgi:hypothetical protein
MERIFSTVEVKESKEEECLKVSYDGALKE